MTNVVYLHGQPQPIAQFIRVGSSGHRRLEQLLAAGRLPDRLRRFVIDAGTFSQQGDLVSALQNSDREVALDTNIAELSSPGRYQGFAKGAPWAKPDGMLSTGDFTSRANEFDLVGKIARFAVSHNISRIHAPAHLVTGVKDEWLKIDIETCSALRQSLDIEGGTHIAIDYPLMISNAVLNDPAERKALLNALSSAPVESIWLRISGFGASATAVGLRKYIIAAQDFHELGKPLISDGIGGFSALAVSAFGAVCGVAHGVAEKERFDASEWIKPRRTGGGGGGYNVLVQGIDRLLKREEAEALMAASGARRLLSCNNRTCCPHGFEDTLKDPKGHYLRQRARQLEALSCVPEPRRVQHYLDVDLAGADRTARQIAKLKIADDALSAMVGKNAERFDRLRAVLEDLHKTMVTPLPIPTLPPPATKRQSSNNDRRR